MAEEQRTNCKHPDPDKQGTTIATWKFDLVRAAILEAVDESPDGIAFRDLPAIVRSRLDGRQLEELGSVSWYTTVVKLHLEAVNEIERVPGRRPQVIRLIR